MTDNSNTQPATTVNVAAGSGIEVSGDGVRISNNGNSVQVSGGNIRVLVIDYTNQGSVDHRTVPAGSCVRDVITPAPSRTISVNGQPATPSQVVEDGDKITASPSRPAGGR